MIWESSYWKDDLLRMAARLRRARRQKRWTEASYAQVEKCFLLGFYSVRRLLEAKKLSDSVVKQVFRITHFPTRGRVVHYMNWHKVGELYDLDNGRPGDVGLRDLCNRFVHSYVLTPVHDEHGGLTEVFVASEFERSVRLSSVPVKAITNLFERVGNDYPTKWDGHFNGKNWKISQR